MHTHVMQNSSDYRDVPVTALIESSSNPRKRFDENSLSSSRLFGSKRLRGLVGDSASAVMGTLRYSWLLTAFCVLGMIFSPLIICWSCVGGLGAHVGCQNETVQVLACYAAPASGPFSPFVRRDRGRPAICGGDARPRRIQLDQLVAQLACAAE